MCLLAVAGSTALHLDRGADGPDRGSRGRQPAPRISGCPAIRGEGHDRPVRAGRHLDSPRVSYRCHPGRRIAGNTDRRPSDQSTHCRSGCTDVCAAHPWAAVARHRLVAGNRRSPENKGQIAPRLASMLLTPTLPRLNAVVEDYELLPLDNVFELYDRCVRVLVMTSPSFDFKAPQLPDNVRYVGPQLDDPDWAVETTWQRRGNEPLVLVAMSSIYQDQTDMLAANCPCVGPAAREGHTDDRPGCRSRPDPGRRQRRCLTGCPARTDASRSLRCRNPCWSRHRAEVARSRCAAGVHTNGPRSARQHRSGAAPWSGRSAQQESNAVTDCRGHFGDSRTPTIQSGSREFANVLAWEAKHRPRAADEAEAWCDNRLPLNPFPRIKP